MKPPCSKIHPCRVGNHNAVLCRLNNPPPRGRFATLMRTKLPLLSLKLVACSLFLSSGRLPAQTQALAQPARPIVQKDYDELRHEAGRAKPEEVPVLQQKAEGGRSSVATHAGHDLSIGMR